MALPTFCQLRLLLTDSAKDLCPSEDLDIADVNKLTERSFGYSSKFQTNAAYSSMQDSVFCLVPRGDTPSSRRLFDAVAAGCIPVIIGDDYEPPFQHALNYSHFSVRVSVAKMLENPCEVIETFRQMDSNLVRSLQAGVKHAARWLSYGSIMMVDDTLHDNITFAADNLDPTFQQTLRDAFTKPVPGVQPGGAIDLAISAVVAAQAKQGAAIATSSPCGSWEATNHPEAINAAKLHGGTPSKLFVIFSRPRSGSTVLCDHLNQQPNVTMMYDVFRESGSFGVDPFGVRRLRCDLGYCEDSAWRADLPGLLHALSLQCPTRFCGFRILDDQVAQLDLEQLFAGKSRNADNAGYPAKMMSLEREDVKAEFHAVSREGATGEDWGATLCLDSRTAGAVINKDNGYRSDLANFKEAHKQWFRTVRAFKGKHGQLLQLTTEQIIEDAKEVTLRALDFLGLIPDPRVDLLAPWDDCSSEGGGFEDSLARDLRVARQRRSTVSRARPIPAG